MKAILTIDMPGTCYDCPLAMWQFETLATSNKHEKHIFACVLTHKAITSTKRSRFCPLLPMPEKKTAEKVSYLGGNPYRWEHLTEYEEGWNACIEYLEGDGDGN